MSTSSRRRASSSSKWQPPPPPPTPKILHLPRHIRLLSRHPKPPPPAAAARNLRCLFKEEILNHHPQCGSNAALPKPEKTQVQTSLRELCSHTHPSTNIVHSYSKYSNTRRFCRKLGRRSMGATSSRRRWAS